MDNQRKLELTLCGMLPYGLKCRTKNGDLILTEYSIRERWKAWFHFPYGSKNKILKYNYETVTDRDCIGKGYLLNQVKPILYCKHKLTEPVLQGNKTPIKEIMKEFGIHQSKTLSLKEMILSQSDFYFTKDLTDNIRFDTLFKIIEKLKEWHFNIYDLPSDMYIEKSTLNQTQ